MNHQEFQDIVIRSDRWSRDSVFLPDSEVQGEQTYRIIQDRIVLVEEVSILRTLLASEKRRATHLHYRCAETIKEGAKTYGELQEVRKLLVATAAILPYRKNKNAQAVQDAVLAYAKQVGLEEELKSQIAASQLKKRERKSRKELPGTGPRTPSGTDSG